MKEAKKQLLHIGCGVKDSNKLPPVFRKPEWQEIRLDNDASVEPDILEDIFELDKVKKESMDGIFTAHHLQKLPHHRIPAALKEIYRVMKEDGLLVACVPDLQALAAYVAEGTADQALYEEQGRKVTPIDMLYGSETVPVHAGLTAHAFARLLLDAGYCNIVVRRDWIWLWASAHKMDVKNPERKHQAQITTLKMQGPNGQNLPFWYMRKMQINETPDLRTDDIDSPPALWKKIGLKK